MLRHGLGGDFARDACDLRGWYARVHEERTAASVIFVTRIDGHRFIAPEFEHHVAHLGDTQGIDPRRFADTLSFTLELGVRAARLNR